MTKLTYLLTALVIFGNCVTMNLTDMPTESTQQPNPLSEPVNRLSGRLRVEFEDLNPGLRHAVYLELRNHSFAPVAVTNQPFIHAELFDSSGRTVNPSGIQISGPIPDPQWGVIPRDAYMGFRVDRQIVGVPTREQGKALIAVGDKSWELAAGAYRLKTTVVFKEEDAPPNHWVGELEVPPVEIVVTTQMLELVNRDNS